ncbi:MAG TPA: Crp/Fnr family transcriptional regulator [Elusimicrobiota bacterium]|nr:Crp/Fnr family transcriptional regulator [Elusimicrobiota bacterium]
MNHLSAFLSRIEPFSQLPLEELDRVAMQAQVVKHNKSEVVYHEGEEGSHVWTLMQGRLTIFKYNSIGKPLAIETIHPKQMFGTLCRLGGTSPTYPCTAVASMNSVSVRMSDRLFQNLCTRFPAMVSSACRLCSERLGVMQARAATAVEPVRQRIVKVLLQLQKTSGNELPYTKREISELSGTTVETTIRVLSEFNRNHWIASSRGKITLKDVVRLRSCLGEGADWNEASSRPNVGLMAVV